MDLSDDQRHDLDVALNEATLLGAEVDAERRAAALTFSVLSLPPDDGPPPHDARVQFILGPVGRLAASLRNGRWDDAHAAAWQQTVRDFAQHAIGIHHHPNVGRYPPKTPRI